jgi:hypothetical protein|tara:strand:+ start:30 stop:350 length:321 start_codon:yes stop_codon:yes gene_type:complete
MDSKTRMNIFLIVQIATVPKDPRKTSQKGYMSNPNNHELTEIVVVRRGLRDKDRRNSIVLDLTEEKVVKDIYSADKTTTFDEYFKHFYEGFGDYINESVNKLNENI